MARVFARIEGSVLRWARTSAGYDVATAASRLGIDPEVYNSWETEDVDASPSVPQLRKLAALFKRPLAVFFLPEPPTTFQVLRDLRRLPRTGTRTLPASVQLEINAAEQHRAIVVEMADDLEVEPLTFALTANVNDDAERVGAQIRVALGVTMSLQERWREPEGRAAFNAWRSRIESLGVLVFQCTLFSSDDASGFAIYKSQFPIIAVNRADTPTRRTFSLLHELAHLMLHQSGVSDLQTDVTRPPEDQAIEVFCNQVAAAALMPIRDLEAQSIVAKAQPLSETWSDAEISELARTFGVSREALVRRLLTIGKTTERFYRLKQGQYAAELADRKARQKAETPLDGIPRNIPQEAISNLGRPMLSMVLGNYHQDRLTLSEVSGYLGIKAKHIPKLEQALGMR